MDVQLVCKSVSISTGFLRKSLVFFLKLDENFMADTQLARAIVPACLRTGSFGNQIYNQRQAGQLCEGQESNDRRHLVPELIGTFQR